MSGNTYRIKQEGKGSLFSRVEAFFRFESAFESGLPVRYLPYILFTTVLAVIYIGNSHYAEKTIRKIDRLKKEVEDLRADYTTLKADYMFDSKQSEVAKNVSDLGITESVQPPEKIELETE